MSPSTLQGLIVFMFLIILVGGFILAIIGFAFQQRLRELAIKERIAMIEKGLVPSPEIDPARFEMLVGVRRPLNRKAERYRSAGMILMGLGVAMVFLLAFAAGVTKVAFGVGGAVAILGLATFLNGMLYASEEPPRPSA